MLMIDTLSLASPVRLSNGKSGRGGVYSIIYQVLAIEQLKEDWD
jgi:hypothetical protein